MLRAHREEMRVMMDVIEAGDLEEVLEDEMVAQTGNTGVCLGIYDSDMDEPSDAEDPEAALKKEVAGLRAEAADTRAFMSAVQGALDCRSVMLDLERARMVLEDLRSEKAFRAAIS